MLKGAKGIRRHSYIFISLKRFFFTATKYHLEQMVCLWILEKRQYLVKKNTSSSPIFTV